MRQKLDLEILTHLLGSNPSTNIASPLNTLAKCSYILLSNSPMFVSVLTEGHFSETIQRDRTRLRVANICPAFVGVAPI